jgi:hypothetical protein
MEFIYTISTATELYILSLIFSLLCHLELIEIELFYLYPIRRFLFVYWESLKVDLKPTASIHLKSLAFFPSATNNENAMENFDFIMKAKLKII